MNYLTSLFLGVVEGLTEFLPISSTAHLKIASKFLELDQDAFQKTFEIAIQSGAILAVAFLYWRDFLGIQISFPREKIQTEDSLVASISITVKKWKTLLRVLVAFLPTAVIGFTFYKMIKEVLLGDNPWIEVTALAVGGVFLILFEFWHREKEDSLNDISKISYGKCILIGCCQSIAVIPGVSRAAATIIGGLALGVKRKTAVEFSFLLAVPTMAAATAYDLYKNAPSFNLSQFQYLGIGFLASFIVAIAAIKFLLHYVRSHTFTAFGVYRILFAGLVGFWLLSR